MKYLFTDTVKVGKNIRSHINMNKNCTMNYIFFTLNYFIQILYIAFHIYLIIQSI